MTDLLDMNQLCVCGRPLREHEGELGHVFTRAMTDRETWMTDEWIAEKARIENPEGGFPEWSEDTIVALAREIQRLRGALAEQEARHKREVIEARIDTLTAHGDCVCPIYSVYGERLSAVDPECVVCSALKRLESELAAMEVMP